MIACGGSDQFSSGDDYVESAELAVTAPGAAVAGFEDAAQWTLTSGTKLSQTDSVDGTSSLNISKFYYTEIRSNAFSASQLGDVVTDAIALEFKAPSETNWGNIQLVLDAPSVGIYNQYVGNTNLTAEQGGDFRTLNFPLNSTIKQQLAQVPSDLKIIIRASLPYSETGYNLDRLHYYSPTKIEVRVPYADDVVELSIAGIRRRIGTWGTDSSQWRDISDWFPHGQSDITLINDNLGGPGGYSFEMRINGEIYSSLNCQSGNHCLNNESGVIAREKIVMPWLDRPDSVLKIEGRSGGKIYINDQYIGKTSPATLRMPLGAHRIGLGVSSDIFGAYTGSFYEQNVVLTSNGNKLNFTSSQALPVQKVSKVAVLPIQKYQTPVTSEIAVLRPSDVTRFAGQIEATRSQYFKPFSYGLADWNITVLPMGTEQTEIDGNVLSSPKYADLLQQYDYVIVYVSAYNANQQAIEGTGGLAWASGGDVIVYPSSWVLGNGENQPAPGLLHETLHLFEHDQAKFQLTSVGVQGLHGAEEHGYTDTNGWVDWYAKFLRGQAGEVYDMAVQLQGKDENYWPAPVNSGADYYTGTFLSIRYGLEYQGSN